MKIISLFNNKGGVGKSTLAFHLGHALSEMGNKVMFMDLDPQCNLTICCMQEEQLHKIWQEEDLYIDDFETSYSTDKTIINNCRSIHFLLKPAEDGLSEFEKLPPVYSVSRNLDLIPGRLSIHRYENKIAERWSGAYQSDNLAIRTITNIRNICLRYTELNNYDYIIMDTSPSLGILNKVIISTVDGFVVPAQPDMFSLYGIRNIGSSLESWQKDLNVIYSLISDDKRAKFPNKFVQFLGYTIYNAKKYTKKGISLNDYDLAQAHYQYASQIPETILRFIKRENRENISEDIMANPIGGKNIMHTHNTFPAISQALKCPMWKVPQTWSILNKTNPKMIEELSEKGFTHNTGNNGKMLATKDAYVNFATDLISRLKLL